MCGLFGTVLDNNEAQTIVAARAARDTLTHRGPDQDGDWYNDNVYLGHRRLSILDLSETGRQPMCDDGQRIIITVNGEIYNFQPLKSELEKSGYRFKSQSDSEVVLYGYKHWGAEGLAERIDGMYAAVIYDATQNQIFIIRDRVGVKPLYYHFDDRGFSWASELKALKSWIPNNRLQTNNEALFDFLTYRYIPAPKTLYQNVYKLPAAHILRLDVNTHRLHLHKYWSLPLSEGEYSDHNEIEETLNNLVKKHVKEQMVSDVPIGFLLSGGIDSSVITMFGAQLSSSPLTFSIGFKNPERDESQYAKIVADLAHTDHHTHILDDEEMLDIATTMKSWFDEPFADTSAVPTQRVCSYAREHVIVALSGDGGDELFGGYKWYDRFDKNQKVSKALFFMPRKGLTCLPQWLPKRRGFVIATTQDPVIQYAYIRGAIFGKALGRWHEILNIPKGYDRFWAYRKYYNPHLSVRKAAQVMDFHTYLPDDILTKVDRVSMLNGLECRPPFLSKEIVEFAFSLPESFIYKQGMLKGGMKSAFSRLLPDDILYRRKQGFSVPDTGWRKNLSKDGIIQEALIGVYLNK